MLYFPQLIGGSVSQYPVSRSTSVRTVSNGLLGGDAIRMADAPAAMVRWQLTYANLTDQETQAINQLFAASEGQLNTFTFLDPIDNLLTWTEDWTKPAWAADPLLMVTVGQNDPAGGTGAIQLTNTAQAVQQLSQKLAVASWFQYCFSVYLRSDAPCSVQLFASCTGQQRAQAANVGPSWSRIVLSGALTDQTDGVAFGVSLPAGVRIYAYGAQAEAQPSPGPYKRATDRAGVYAKTRFAADSLSINADAVSQTSCRIDLLSSLQ